MGVLRWLLQAILVLLLVVSIPLAVVGNWADRQVFDTNAFVDSVGPLSSNPVVQRQATKAIMTYLDSVDKTELKLTAGADYASQRGRIEKLVELIVSSKPFDQTFVTVISGTHSVVVDLLEKGKTDPLKLSAAGMVVLDLTPTYEMLVTQVSDLGIGDFSSAMPTSVEQRRELQIELFKGDDLAKAKRYATALDTAALWLIVVSAVAAVLYVVVAKNKGLGLFGLGVIALVGMGALRAAHHYGRDVLITELKDADQKALAGAVYDISLHTLLNWIQLGLFAGGVLVIIGFLWSRVRKATAF